MNKRMRMRMTATIIKRTKGTQKNKNRNNIKN